MEYEPTSCPRYLTCSAPICPLDPDWPKRSHLHEDRVCIWLTELSKPGGEQRIRLPLEGAVAQRVVQTYPEISASYGVIRNRLVASSKTGSRLEQQQRAGERLGALRKSSADSTWADVD
jgi:hypothetical protein